MLKVNFPPIFLLLALIVGCYECGRQYANLQCYTNQAADDLNSFFDDLNLTREAILKEVTSIIGENCPFADDQCYVLWDCETPERMRPRWGDLPLEVKGCLGAKGFEDELRDQMELYKCKYNKTCKDDWCNGFHPTTPPTTTTTITTTSSTTTTTTTTTKLTTKSTTTTRNSRPAVTPSKSVPNPTADDTAPPTASNPSKESGPTDSSTVETSTDVPSGNGSSVNVMVTFWAPLMALLLGIFLLPMLMVH